MIIFPYQMNSLFDICASYIFRHRIEYRNVIPTPLHKEVRQRAFRFKLCKTIKLDKDFRSDYVTYNDDYLVSCDETNRYMTCFNLETLKIEGRIRVDIVRDMAIHGIILVIVDDYSMYILNIPSLTIIDRKELNLEKDTIHILDDILFACDYVYLQYGTEKMLFRFRLEEGKIVSSDLNRSVPDENLYEIHDQLYMTASLCPYTFDGVLGEPLLSKEIKRHEGICVSEDDAFFIDEDDGIMCLKDTVELVYKDMYYPHYIEVHNGMILIRRTKSYVLYDTHLKKLYADEFRAPCGTGRLFANGAFYVFDDSWTEEGDVFLMMYR